jgi:hypothetical protein
MPADPEVTEFFDDMLFGNETPEITDPPQDPAAPVDADTGSVVTDPPPSVVVEPPPAIDLAEPVSPVVSEPEPGPADPEDGMAVLREQNAQLLARIDAMMAKPEAALEPQAVELSDTQVQDFLDGVDPEDMMADPELFNQVLNKAVNHGYKTAVTTAIEQVLTRMPQMVINYVRHHSTMEKVVEDFYTTHPELSAVKRTVATVANEVHAEHPDWKVQQVFDEAATRTKTLLGLKGRVNPITPSSPGPKPALKAGSRGVRSAPSGSPITPTVADEIDQLIN